MKLKGLKKAIGDYNRANAGGAYSPRYGRLMLDKSTGEIWCDEFYDLGHSWYTVYNNPDIINLGSAYFEAHWGECDIEPLTMATVKAFCAERYNIA